MNQIISKTNALRAAGLLLLSTLAVSGDETRNLIQAENIMYTEYRVTQRLTGFNEFINTATAPGQIIKKYRRLAWSGSVKESNTGNYKGTQRTDFTGSVYYTGATATNTLQRREFRNLDDPGNEGDGSGGPYIVQGFPGGGCLPLNRTNLLNEFPGTIGSTVTVLTQSLVVGPTRREFTGHMGLLWSSILLPCNLFDFQTGSDTYQSYGPVAETLSELTEPVFVSSTEKSGYFKDPVAGVTSRMENNSVWSSLSTAPVLIEDVSYKCVLQFRPWDGECCAEKNYIVAVSVEKWVGSGPHTFEERRFQVAPDPSRSGLGELEATVMLKAEQPGEFQRIAAAVLEIDGVVCQTCGSEPGATGGKLGSVNWSMDLGRVPGGKSAGQIYLRSETWTPALFLPTALRFTGPEIAQPTAATAYRADGSLRQVRTGTYLTDIITSAEDPAVASGYEIRFYTQAGSTPSAGDPNLYMPAGSPLYVTKLRDPDGAGTRLTIERFAGTHTSPVSSLEYAYSAGTNTWSFIEGGRRRTDKTVTALSATEEQTLTTVWDITGGVLTKAAETREKYRRYAIGGFTHRVLYERTIDPAGAALTTTWIYVVDTRNMLRMTQVNRPDGSWEKNDYSVTVNATNGEIQRFYNTYSPFVNSAPTDPSSQQRRLADGEVPSSDYDGDGRRDTAGQRYFLLANNTVGGEETRRFTKPVIFDGQSCYVTESAQFLHDYSYSAKRWDRRYILATGPFAGRTVFLRRADLTIEITSYALDAATGQVTETRSSGVPNAAQTAVVDGERTVTLTDVDGRLISSTTTDISTGLVTQQQTVMNRDDYGRPTVILHTDGSLEERNYYPCCGWLASVKRYGMTTSYAYDELGRLVSESSHGITLLYAYDAIGRRLKTTRRGSDGSEIVIAQTEYDLAGQIKSQTDAGNRVTSFTEVHNADRTTTRTKINPDLGTVIEVFNADSSLASRSGTAAAPITRTYALGYTNSGGTLLTTEYKGAAGTSSPEWVRTHTDRDGRIIAVETPDFGRADNGYDQVGRIERSTDADYDTTLYAYDARGEQSVVARDLDDSWTIDFTGVDRLTRTTRSVGTRDGATVNRVITEAWETNGQDTPTVVAMSEQSVDGLRSWQTNRGVTTSTVIAYDGQGGRTVTTTGPDGTVTTQVFLEERLQSTTVAHPSLGSLLVTTYAYDTHGRLKTTTDARNGTTAYTYFNDDQIGSVITPDPDPARAGPGYDPQTTTYGYDAGGRQNRITLPDGGIKTTEFLPTGAVKKISGARTYPVEYTYDDQGRLKTLKTWRDFASGAGAAVTTWNYNPAHGWLDNKRYADGQGPAYTYTPAGRLSTRTWARGTVTTYGYNLAGDLILTDYGDATPDVALTYDRSGRLLTRSDAGGLCTWSYHSTGQLEDETYSTGPLSGLVIDRTLDVLGRTTNLTLPSQYTIGYGYDAASRLSTVTFGTAQAQYAYEPLSAQVSSISYFDSGSLRLTTSRNYDRLDRLAAMTNTISTSGTGPLSAYTYNSANQRIKTTREDGLRWDYGYDALGQVTSAVKSLAGGEPIPGYAYGYLFDDIGNRKNATANGQIGAYSANDINQYSMRTVPGTVDVSGEAETGAKVTVTVGSGLPQATMRQGRTFFSQLTVDNAAGPRRTEVKITGVKNNVGPNGEDAVTETSRTVFTPAVTETFGYDADGDLTDDARWHYTWDAENRLVAIETQATAIAAGMVKQKLEFAYDGMGRRIAKKVYSWDGAAWVLGANTLFLYDGWNLLAELNAMSSTAAIRTYAWGLDLSGSSQGAGGVGGLLFTAFTTPSVSLHAPCYDGNGNVIGYVDMAAGAKSATYEFGAFGEALIADGVAAEAMPFRFSTKFTDNETDLLYYGLRFYSPSSGRWINRDPIEERGGASLYALLGNNPINDTDMIGLVGGVAGNRPFSDSERNGARQRAFELIVWAGNVAPGLPQKLLRQWLWKQGDYELTDDEFTEHVWGPNKYHRPKVKGVNNDSNHLLSLTHIPEFNADLKAKCTRPGTKFTQKYKFLDYARSGRTLGNFFLYFDVEVTCGCSSGEFEANGNVSVDDKYDFDPGNRTPQDEADVAKMRMFHSITGMGQDFWITSKKYQVKEKYPRGSNAWEQPYVERQ